MPEASGDCFVRVGLPYGGWGQFEARLIATSEDCLRAAFHCAGIRDDANDCTASHDTQKLLCNNHLPVVDQIGLISSCITRTGWRAVEALCRYTRMLERIGVFGTELEVVPDRLAKFLTENNSLIMPGTGAGKHADAQYLFTEEVCRYGKVTTDLSA